MSSLPSLLHSQPNCETTKAATIDYLKKRGRLELWSGILANLSMKRADAERAANSEAEAAHVRRTVWGSNVGGEKMQDTYLGDVTHVHETKPGNGGSNLVKGLLGAGLLATGIGAPLGGMMIANALTQQAVAPVDTDTNTQYELRLGEPSP